MINKFEDIVAWQKAKELTIQVYKILNCSPDFAFNNQLQRAAVSVMNNIAEGFERKSNNEFQYFLYIAKGSCGEVRSMLHLAIDLKKIDSEEANRLISLCNEISKLIAGFIKSLQINPTTKPNDRHT